ncbi:MAG: hypothetical protein QE263_05270 [Vampirovibrionales bacterium]|nr:hypothetical protein [Vampirovibrionales bacterium]
MRYVLSLLLTLVSVCLLTSIAAPLLKGGVSESVALKADWPPGWQVTIQQANGKPAPQVPVALPQVGWEGTTNHSGRVTIPAIPQATAVIRIQGAEKLGEPLWDTLPSITSPPANVMFRLKASTANATSRMDDTWHHLGDGRYEAWSLGAKAFQTQQAEGPVFETTFTCPKSTTKQSHCTITLGMVQGLDTQEAHQQAGITQKSTASPLMLSINNRWQVAIVLNGSHQRWAIPANALNPSGQQMLTLTAGSHLNVLGQLDYDDCEFGGLWVTAH